MPSVLAPPRLRGVPLAIELRAHGDNVALISDHERLTYAELAARVDAVAERLFGTHERRLVLLTPRNDIDGVVHLLAALATSNPVLLVPGDDPAKLKNWTRTYDPDVLIAYHGGEHTIEVRRDTSAHDLHPELALLVSTSGSTGSPKLVRLSGDNVQANAEQIAAGLGITADDRAITTLPPAYVYGLSVLTSHLLRGAGIILNDASVVDPCFWDRAQRARVTSFAGVPYTFELLERLDVDAHLDRVPSLRQITQAGGRLPAGDVARWTSRAMDRGFDFAVMYGQSEATARMCIARSPDLVANPSCVGRPVAGSHVRIERSDTGEASDPIDKPRRMHDQQVGELVFTGTNVMLGYAEAPADLALGRTTNELRTGDLALIDDEGRVEIVGRIQRFAKILGLRVDLQRLEDSIATEHFELHAVSDDRTISLLAAPRARRTRPTSTPPDVHELKRSAVAVTGLPAGAITVVPVDALPRNAGGKVDGAAARELAAAAASAPPTAEPSARASRASSSSARAVVTADDVRELMAVRLHRPDATVDDSFVSLGGDSLSYVELSVALESLLGTLPSGWQHRSIQELAHVAAPQGRPAGARRPFALRQVDSTIVLRALAIIAVVGSHIETFDFRGGAHLLIAIVGFNLARFQLVDVERRARVRRLWSATAAVAVPCVLWLWVMVALSERHTWPNALLINTFVGSVDWTPAWKFWFVEALIYLLVGVTVLLTIPWVDRLERRWRFGLPLALLAVALLGRYDVFVDDPGTMHLFTAASVVWLFALGWAIQRATKLWQRGLVSVIVLITVPGFSANPDRVHCGLAGLMVLIWLPTVRIPSLAIRPLAIVASASLWIYLTHWVVFPPIRTTSQWLALVACLLVGIAASATWERLDRAVRTAWRLRRPTAGAPSQREAARTHGGETAHEQRPLVQSLA